MPNHFHALVRIKEEEVVLDVQGVRNKYPTGFENLSGIISQQFSNLFNSYTKSYNKVYKRRGSLFNRPFKSKAINSDTYLTNIIFYIHHNAIYHGFCSCMGDWPHSSYHAFVSNKQTRLKREEVQKWFGSKEEFKRFHDQSQSPIFLNYFHQILTDIPVSED